MIKKQPEFAMKKTEKPVNLSVRVSSELRSNAQTQAEKEGRTFSNLIVHALREYLSRKGDSK